MFRLLAHWRIKQKPRPKREKNEATDVRASLMTAPNHVHARPGGTVRREQPAVAQPHRDQHIEAHRGPSPQLLRRILIPPRSLLSPAVSLGLSVSLPVCLSASASVSQSLCLCLSVSLSLCLSVSLSPCLPVSLSPCLPASLSLCLSVSPSLCPPACLPVCLSVSLSRCLAVSLPRCLATSVSPVSPVSPLPPASCPRPRRATAARKAHLKCAGIAGHDHLHRLSHHGEQLLTGQLARPVLTRPRRPTLT